MNISSRKNSISHLPLLRCGFLLVAVTLACYALPPQARAVCQEGCDLSNDNTFLGDDALINNTTGNGNTAIGQDALFGNTTGYANSALGQGALQNNSTGNYNTAVGAGALLENTTGFENTATGIAALNAHRTGNYNTAIGATALYTNAFGSSNTAIGWGALANNGGNNNIALGFQAGFDVSGSDNIDIGNEGLERDSKTIRIGQQGTQTATFIAGIYGPVSLPGIPVYVNPSGQLGTLASSARFKDEIQPMDKASKAIFALKPVTFHYKKEIDPKSTAQFGLVAEEVEKVDPDLVVRDAKGKVFAVRYDAVNAMLLNEFLKEHKAFLKEHRKVEQLEKQVEALAAGLQKVSAQLEMSRPVQTVANNQ